MTIELTDVDQPPLYPSNVLEGFGSGCLLDLRVRLAVDLLKSPMFTSMSVDGMRAPEIPGECARFALDLATALMAEAESRGLVQPIPADNGELPDALRAQARRTASFQALQQIEGGRFVQEEQGRVVPQAPVLTGRGRH